MHLQGSSAEKRHSQIRVKDTENSSSTRLSERRSACASGCRKGQSNSNAEELDLGGIGALGGRVGGKQHAGVCKISRGHTKSSPRMLTHVTNRCMLGVAASNNMVHLW
ncbi:hypothetical protein EYF80_032794 [Liparis tanakae]|uniref:Uncharacterized protein n=1 Tax=Liparis tanakae TaxID=230148 RepID=A0A4Z2GW39_9TELE|nr:hypothetical protein EYF80_032794 [Liparis tanakae]